MVKMHVNIEMNYLARLALYRAAIELYLVLGFDFDVGDLVKTSDKIAF